MPCTSLICAELRDWLQLKGDDPTAVLARWWLTEFEEAQ